MKRLIALPLAALLLVAAGDPATETEHVVTSGETLSGIASRAGVPMSAIAEANGLAQPYVIKVGQKLAIPRQKTHVVKKGDTGFAIAFQYGVPFDQIALANGIGQDAILKVGQKLIIPAMIVQPASPAKPAPAPAPAISTASAKAPAFRLPHQGKVMLSWRRRSDGTGHEGLDFKVNTGDAVRAAAAGKVIFAGEASERFGNLVVIDHGNGWHSAYGHLSKVTVKKGDPVRSGERVGLGGQSGDAKEPELHFEIRRDGQPVDPAPLLGVKAGQ